MKAELKIQDIGGLSGQHSYTLESGKLNLIESSNAGGKTSVIRSLVGILSVPKNGIFDSITMNEAFRLGIKTDPRNPREGFVNIHAEKGVVELEYNGRQDQYIVNKSGEYVILPNLGDQRFLLTGILSNEARIIRQLKGLEDYEPDDFKWAVTLLSNAKGYDQVADALKNIKEDLEDKKLWISSSIDQKNLLSKQKIQLEEELVKLDQDLFELRPRFSGIEPLLEERSKISKGVDDLNVKIGDKLGELGKITKEKLEIPKKRIEKAEKEKKRILNELEKINIKDLEKDRRLKSPEYEKEIIKNREIRGEVDGLLNLFITAEASLHKKNQKKQLLCPLCENGKLNSNNIKIKINELRDKRDILNEEILKLTQLKFGLDRILENEKLKYDKLKEDLLVIKEDISNAIESMRGPERAIKSIQSTIDGYRKSIEEKKGLLKELTKKISKSDEQINKEYTDKEQERTNVSLEIGKILQQIGQISSIDLLGNIIEPDKGKIKCENLLILITKLLSYAEKKAEQERQEASKQFNSNIQILMNNLNFTDFKDVKLNNEYRLYIERLNPDTNDYVDQQPKTLSTSEKHAIALVLQIALKDTYMPNVPFFILDDILEDFDDDRMKKVIEYMNKKAKEEDIFIVMTKLVEEIGLPKIKYLK